LKLVIIESPFKGDNWKDLERNKRYLRSCIRDCIVRGESPYASHRMLTDALDDRDPAERALGIEAGLAWRHVRQPVFDDDSNIADSFVLKHLLTCHAFYVDLGYSSGMTLAKEKYESEGVLYEERTLPADDLFFTPVAAMSELTEDELTELSVFAPNLACIIEREPPKNSEATRKLAREELAWLIRGARSKQNPPQESDRNIDIDDGC
jgi:hypothetical protein